MTTDKVVLAEEDVTVHIALGKPIKQGGNELWPVESRSLVPGETVEFDSLPGYLQKSIEAGTVTGLKLLDAEEAAKILAERNRILGIQEEVPTEATV